MQLSRVGQEVHLSDKVKLLCSILLYVSSRLFYIRRNCVGCKHIKLGYCLRIKGLCWHVLDHVFIKFPAFPCFQECSSLKFASLFHVSYSTLQKEIKYTNLTANGVPTLTLPAQTYNVE